MRASINKTPIALPKNRSLCSLIWPAIFLLPLVLWQLTSDVMSYFYYGAPKGQLGYVFSKLFGLYAVLLLWYQTVSALLKNTNYIKVLPQWAWLYHQRLGMLAILIVIFHIVCFITAASLRQEALALDLLLPNFQDFYHTAITIGVGSFLVLLPAAIAALLRRKLPTLWKDIHRSMVFIVLSGLLHGYLIGTESRYGYYDIFYIGLMASIFIALVLRWRTVPEEIL